MDSVRLATALSSSSLCTQMLSRNLGITRSRNSVYPVAVMSKDETFTTLPSLPRLKVSSNSLQYPAGYLGAVPERTSDPGDGSIVEAMDYLTNILSTKVYDVVIESPLQLAKKLSERLGVRMFLKREDLQPVFSFKLRGAYNTMVKLPEEQL
ncbi:hypothetical protein AALP_AA3G107000 [Arabis alpina]|uniref:Tryptophan synthase beta chain-like PALP domain-containing protein n=1 Tax=Arabis alpina TaxID=50452 RepID=A0A087H8D6_ARAAL|nr:hypothetical protein AALP_AA3G107000 [Arabis alpina]